MTSEQNKKILIIDDKAESEKNSSITLLKGLKSKYKSLIDFKQNTKGLWMLNENEDEIIDLNIDLHSFDFIILHQSFDDPVISEPIKILMPILPKSTKLILFSGDRRTDLKSNDKEGLYDLKQNPDQIHYEIRRSILFENFENFMDSFNVLGKFRIEALYDKNYNVTKEKAEHLFNLLIINLEESEMKAINSKEFEEFFYLAGYRSNEIVLIRNNFSSKDYNEIYELLEDELTKF